MGKIWCFLLSLIFEDSVLGLGTLTECARLILVALPFLLLDVIDTCLLLSL